MTGPEPRVLGDIGTRIVHEDDRVRVWVLKLAPGEQSAVHRHDLDHLLIQVKGDRIAVIPEPDSRGPFTEPLAAEVVAGAVVPVAAGGIETARNVGSEDYLEVIVELKRPGAGGGTGASRPRSGPGRHRPQLIERLADDPR